MNTDKPAVPVDSPQMIRQAGFGYCLFFSSLHGDGEVRVLLIVLGRLTERRLVGRVGIHFNGCYQEGLGLSAQVLLRSPENALVQVAGRLDHGIRVRFCAPLAGGRKRGLPSARLSGDRGHLEEVNAIHLQHLNVGRPGPGHLIHPEKRGLAGDRLGGLGRLLLFGRFGLPRTARQNQQECGPQYQRELSHKYLPAILTGVDVP